MVRLSDARRDSPHPQNGAGGARKLLPGLFAAILLLPAAVLAAAGTAADKAGVNDICDDNGGGYQEQGEGYACVWGDRGELHFVKFDRAACRDGCNADGPMGRNAGFGQLKITDPVKRAQAQQQQILFLEKILRRRAILQKKNN